MFKETILNRAKDIGRHATEIEELMAQIDEDETEPEIPDVDKPKGAAPSHLIVGFGEAAPGKVAEFDILGGTEIGVLGYGMRFGVHTALELNHFYLTQEMKELTGLPRHEIIVEQADWDNSIAYGKGAYISVFHLFRAKFLQSAEVKRLLAEIEAVEKKIEDGTLVGEQLEEAKSRLVAMHKEIGEMYPAAEPVIPAMTPMLTIGVKVPEDAEPGTVYKLLNRSNWFGRPLTSPQPEGRPKIGRQRINNIFGTSHEYAEKGNPYRFGLEAELISGELKVV